MEENGITQEQIDAQIAFDEECIKRGKYMKELQEDEKFKYLFQDIFIDAWAITNTLNMALNDRETDAAVMLKMKARGIFAQFCNQLIDDANISAQNLAEYRALVSDKEDFAE